MPAPVPADKRLSVPTLTRLTPGEHKALGAAVAELGTTKSRFIRDLVVAALTSV